MDISSPNIFYYPQSNIDYNSTQDDRFMNSHRLNNIFSNKITASIPQIKPLPSPKREDNRHNAFSPISRQLGGNTNTNANNNNNNPFLFSPQSQQQKIISNGNDNEEKDISNNTNVKTAAVTAFADPVIKQLGIDGARGGEGINNDKNNTNINNNNNNNNNNTSVYNSSFLSSTYNDDQNNTPSSSYEYINSEMAKMVENSLRTILAAMPLLPVPVFVPPNTDDVNIKLEINNMMPFYFQQQAPQQRQM